MRRLSTIISACSKEWSCPSSSACRIPRPSAPRVFPGAAGPRAGARYPSLSTTRPLYTLATPTRRPALSCVCVLPARQLTPSARPRRRWPRALVRVRAPSEILLGFIGDFPQLFRRVGGRARVPVGLAATTPVARARLNSPREEERKLSPTASLHADRRAREVGRPTLHETRPRLAPPNFNGKSPFWSTMPFSMESREGALDPAAGFLPRALHRPYSADPRRFARRASCANARRASFAHRSAPCRRPFIAGCTK